MDNEPADGLKELTYRIAVVALIVLTATMVLLLSGKFYGWWG